MKKVCFIFGTRPETLKFAPVIREFQKRGLDFFIIHTNQHKDSYMSYDFIKELNLPDAKYVLKKVPFEIKEMTEAIKKILRKEKPSYVFVQGDTDTAFIGTLASHYLRIPVIHRESGVRSNDRRMQEEKNRIIIDKLAFIHFCPTKISINNLLKENVKNNIFLVGNTLVDSIEMFKDKLNQINLPENNILFTFHRKENVENPVIFKRVLENLSKIGRQIVYPIHPYSKQMIDLYGINVPDSISLMQPLNYFLLLSHIISSQLVVTDSGGIQEECAILNKPCVVLRKTTDRPELLDIGASILIDPTVKEWPELRFKKKWTQPYKKNVSVKIVDIMQSKFI